MSPSGRLGIPTDRENPYNLKINADGSIEVLTRLREMFPNEPSPFTVGITPSVISAASENTRVVDIYNNSVYTIYIGFSASVTILTGQPILPYCGKVLCGITDPVYAVAGAIGCDVRVLEMTTEE